LGACGGWSHEDPVSGQIQSGLGHLRYFATHPYHIRRGVGRQLMERAEQQAREESTRRMSCPAGLNAVSFYESCGYRRMQNQEILIGNQIRYVIHLLEKEL